MQIHLLLTPDIRATMPATTKITQDWGNLRVIFPEKTYYGTHCFVEDTQENIFAWLRPFDFFIEGNGNPQMETFHIMHIK